MVKTLLTKLSMNMRDVTFHPDTETVLKWIQSKNGKLSVFVGNRIRKIRRETAVNQWHHIPGFHNHADWCSRGIDPVVDSLVNHHSKLIRLTRVIAWCNRFIFNCSAQKKKEKPKTLELSSKEIQQALNFCIRRAQELEFAAEIDCLRRNVEVSESSKL